MDFNQAVLRSILTGADYSLLHLRPNDIFKISKSKSPKLIRITIATEQIDKFVPRKLTKSPIISSSRIQQYNLVCVLLNSINNSDNKQAYSLTPNQEHKLQSLSYSDLIDFVNTSDSNIITTTVNQHLLEMAVFSCKQQNKKNKTIEQLIKAGATKKLMYDEYGLSPKRYKFLRNAFQLDKAFGRPRHLSEQESLKVYEVWLENKSKSLGDVYLIIHEQLKEVFKKDINIRNIATAIDEIAKTA